ncbi:outer membrane protein assembly factor BamE [Muricoccus radiodurans]|uniref:outer membrane protein assembly factor BamE n=1 Tax=Muricoccus radiodurans TaxID=2231721 RepID=UPI003CF5314D
MAPLHAPVNRPLAPRRGRAPWLAALLAASLAGCSFFQAPPQLRGNRVDAEQLREISPGVQTRADVQALLGSPTVTGTFDQDRWYYVSATSRIRPARTPTVEDQRVVMITFNQRGVVQSVEEIDPAQMRNVQVVDRTTPVPGNDRSLLQALFGNIGRFGTPVGGSNQSGPGPAAPAP